MDEREFKKLMAKTAIEALVRNFPEETRQATEKIN
jgi:hypothetical protein